MGQHNRVWPDKWPFYMDQHGPSHLILGEGKYSIDWMGRKCEKIYSPKWDKRSIENVIINMREKYIDKIYMGLKIV